MKKQFKDFKIPFEAKDSELCGWEYIIPEGMEATIVDNKIVVKKKESEDENIKKEIIYHIQHCDDTIDEVAEKRMIAWLEKRCEKGVVLRDTFGYEAGRQRGREEGVMLVLDNPRKYGLEKQGEQKPADKVEPKFKVGDKIRRKTPSSFDKDMQVARIDKDYYVCNHIGKFSSEVVPFSKQSSYELVEQKPAWSEEDEKIYQSIMDDTVQENQLNERQTDWLRDIKYRHFSQPQNRWKPSDEQMDALNLAIGEANSVDTAAGDEAAEILTSLYEQLKKLREE